MNMLDPTSIILFLDFDGVTHPDFGPVDKLFTLMPLIEEVLYARQQEINAKILT